MLHKRTSAQLAVVALAATAVLAAPMTATADPAVPDGTYRKWTAVGSDTTQEVWNALTNNGTGSASLGGPIAGIGSYNAFGTATIKTKSAGATFNRPAGSGNGVKALSAVWDPSYTSHDFQGTALVKTEVDFARSSSGPTAGVGLTYLPFARDALSIATKPYPSSSPTDLTTAQLTAIYGGPDDNTAGTGITYSPTTGLPILNTRTLYPKLPQSGSGTRNFFQAAIGIPNADLASYVEPTPSTLPENDGSVLSRGWLIPFSAAQWIAQRNGAQTNTTSALVLTSINGLAAVVKGSSAYSPGALYGPKNPQGKFSSPPATGVGVFARDTYNVVPTEYLDGTADQIKLVDRLTGTATAQLGAAAAVKIIKQYGFGNLAYLGDSEFYRSGMFLH